MQHDPVTRPSVDVMPLLERLAVGSAQPMYSVADWESRLGGVPYGAEFVAQLRLEWLPATPPDEFCAGVRDFCRERLAAWHSGWPNLWAHILRVAGNALAIAPEAGIDPDQAFLLGVLHDVGKLDEMLSGEPHEQIGATLARQQLAVRFPRAAVNAIAAAIGKADSSPRPLARLIHNADKIDKIGAAGIVRRVSQVIDPANALSSLHRIEADLADFPAMSFPTAERLAALKRHFTEQFLALAGLDVDAERE